MAAKLNIAILDLYEGTENEGMRCIRDLLRSYPTHSSLEISWDEFEVRQKQEIPDLSYDIFISSGGPGSPLSDDATTWEKGYFNWIEQLLAYNSNPLHSKKKFVFFICHSFQLACRFFQVAHLSKRKSMSFGVFPVHMFEQVHHEPCFEGLQNPFYVVDSRYFQITKPDYERIESIGGEILCIEKERAHIPLERAIMALRFNPYMIGTQFHPEVDAEGMRLYLQKDDIKSSIISEHGQEKWEEMLVHLDDPDKIRWTYAQILPNFLKHSIHQLYGN